jgi:hypothetical protein
LSERLFDELGRPVRRTASVVRHIDVQNVASLAAGVREETEFTVPAGRSWAGRRGRVDVLAPPTATAGTHYAILIIRGAFTHLHPFGATAAHNATCKSEASLLDIAMASGRGMILRYNNGTNTVQTNPRNWHIILIEEVS